MDSKTYCGRTCKTSGEAHLRLAHGEELSTLRIGAKDDEVVEELFAFPRFPCLLSRADSALNGKKEK